jgi:hypothetical protein
LFNLEYKDNSKVYLNILERIIPEMNDRDTIFIEHYFKKYDNENLPSWMLFEELAF